MQNQMENAVANDMQTGLMRGFIGGTTNVTVLCLYKNRTEYLKEPQNGVGRYSGFLTTLPTKAVCSSRSRARS